MNDQLLFNQFPYIESDELVLKKIEHEDIEAFYELCSDETLFKYKPGKAKKNITSVNNMIDHYERDFRKKKTIFLGIYLKSNPLELIGLGELFDFDKNVSMVTFGYTLNRRHWGKGYATQYAKMILNYLMGEMDVNRLQAFVMPENTRSQKVLERCGFLKEGTIRKGFVWKDKGVVDLILYSALKEEVIL